MPSPDPWSRVDYRRLIAWPQRIEREWPLLERVLRGAPSPRLLDLGSGTGEHSRYLADRGFEVVGVDSSASMVEKAQEHPLPDTLRFVHADIADIGAIGMAPTGAAICLGNTLPHLEDDAMRRLAQGLASVLLPGAPFLFQVLNYERIRAQRTRHLPLNFRPDDEEGEIVFLRLLAPKPDGRIVFSPTTLRYRPDRDPPVEVMHTRSVTLRAWTWPELREIFSAAGFGQSEVFGGFDGSPFDTTGSPDLIAVLRR